MFRFPVGFSLLFACVGLMAQTGVACAGAWLRDEGTAFFEIKAIARAPDGVLGAEYGFYGEYGAASHLTLGVDLNDNDGQAGHALLFARVPLGQGRTGRTLLAFELAAGGHHLQRQWSGMTRALLSAGRGFSGSLGDGWMNVDVGVERRYGLPDPAYKLDATIGFSGGSPVRPLLQLESTTIPGQLTIWSVTPSVTIDGKGDGTWVLGLEHKSVGPVDTLGLKIALWRRF